MKAIDHIIQEALKRFGIDLEDAESMDNPFYVHVLTEVSKNKLELTYKSNNLARIINPVSFITRIKDKNEDVGKGQVQAGIPNFSFIIGQYGLGKTELVAQTCRFLLKSEEYKNGKIKPLPVALAGCLKYLKNTEKEEFGYFLFNDIIQSLPNIKYSDIKNDILKDIYEGRILLLLDGLDELIYLSRNAKTEGSHYWFLESLSKYMDSGRKISSQSKPNFRIVTSMREEYLSIVASKDASDFNQILQRHFSDSKYNLYFINLTFFDKSRIDAYLDKRKKKMEKEKLQFLKTLTENVKFNEIVRRPLLLRLLADLIEKKTSDFNQVKEKLSKNNHPAFFIRYYVEETVKDEKLQKLQDQIRECDWSPELIAKQCLRMYEEGRQSMTIEDIRNVLIPPKGQSISNLSKLEVMEGIHKCPFLKKEIQGKESEGSENNIRYRFGHKIFFEYFTVEGVHLEEQEKEGQIKDESFGAFDELVLNVDMRKFLRAFTGKKWYARTKIAYGLGQKDWPEWEYYEVRGRKKPIQTQKEFDRLDEQRRILLDTMTAPEKIKKGLEKVIKQFMDEEYKYHPRYLVPNYEAIAVYIQNNIWSKEGKLIYKKFEIALEHRFNTIVNGLKKNSFKLTRAWILLLERIMDIGYRLRFPWIKKMVNIGTHEKLLLPLLDEEVKAVNELDDVKVMVERIRARLFQIKESKIWDDSDT